MPSTDMAQYMAKRRKERRDRLIQMSGLICAVCGGIEDLQFDHRDRETMSFRLSGKGLDGPWERILQEWKKCALICNECHRFKGKELGEHGGGWNKGIAKTGEILPEHGCEGAYAHGCRCGECCKARYEAKVRRGDLSGLRGPRGPQGSRIQIQHGTRAGYQAERRLGLVACQECRKANSAATKMQKQKLLVGRITALCSAVDGEDVSSNLT